LGWRKNAGLLAGGERRAEPVEPVAATGVDGADAGALPDEPDPVERDLTRVPE